MKMNRFNKATMAAVGLLAAVTSETNAQTFRAQPEFEQTLRSVQRRVVRAGVEVENARITPRLDGTVSFIAAPPDHHFRPVGVRLANPEAAASDFVARNRKLVGVVSDRITLTPARVKKKGQRSIVRLEQSYAGIPVYAAEIKVQVNEDLGVEAMMSDILRDTRELDAGRLKIQPTLTAEQAVQRVRDELAKEAGEQPLVIGQPRLVIFDPALFDEDKPVRLAWEINAATADGGTFDDQVFVDAHTGELFDRIPNLHSALDREIYDAEFTNTKPGTLEREEGEAASTIADVNAAYTALGQVYNFYLSNHQRDSWDDEGGTLSATVRYCTTNQGSSTCTYRGKTASWSSGRMYFQPGSAVDDVTGHEVTHGVTGDESGLKYKNQSGAINESFSDIWGEFIDLTNGTGDDSPGVRWIMGEDIWSDGIRNMQNPPEFDDPDRVGSSLYQPSSDTSDNGGVHVNSGVNNKLCYLLVDGGTFNGQTVTGMGISRVADLYYEAQTGLLTATAGWTELYDALQQAAVNLGWTIAERNNLYRACAAVEIAAPRIVYVDLTKLCPFADGGADECGIPFLPFLPDSGGPFRFLQQANAAAQPGDILSVRTGHYAESLVFKKRLKIIPKGGSLVIGQ